MKKFTIHLFKSRYKIAASFLLTFFFVNSSYSQQWKMLGNENQISSVTSVYSAIAVVDNVPYVVYVEGSSSGIAKVKKRNAGTGAWEQVGGDIASNASYTKIYNDKTGKLYVSFIDAGSSGRLAVVTFNATAQAWEPLSPGNLYVSTGSATYTAGISTTRSGLAFGSNDIPYIAYSERNGTTGYPYVKRFVSGAWQTVGSGAVSTDWAASTNIAIDNGDVPHIVYIQQATATSGTGVIKTFRFNTATSTWEDTSPPSPVLPGSSTTGATTAVRHTSIAMDSTYNPVVAYFNTSNSNRSTIIRFGKTTATWNWVGSPGTRDANNNSLINDNGGNVYNLFADALINGGLSNLVRVYKLHRGSSALTELKSPSSTRGIDSTGDNSTAARSISISDLAIAIGSDTSKPFIVYTKTNSSSVRTPIVQVFTQPVKTKAVTNITKNAATAGGDVSDFEGTILERGIVYSTIGNPTTSDTKIVDVSGNAVFTTSLTGLLPATSYHVRAYAANGSGTVYGNDVSFTTLAPDPNSVTVIDNGSTVILNNGLVRATIAKTNATVTSLVYNGLEVISGGFSGGSVYWSWNMPNYQNPSGCTYTLTADPQTNNYNYAEVKLHMTWDRTASAAAMDVDIYYSLLKDASGLYASAKLSHPASYPALAGGEWRMASYPNPMFDWLSVDSLRNRIMPGKYDLDNSVAVAGAPEEVTRLTTGIYANKYECKYDYSADFGVIDVWGWSSTANNVGLWVTAPSKEYYPGGPMKRELTGHATPVLLNMLGGTHYGGGQETSIAAGEVWEKTYGPFLLYCNKVPAGTTNANIALWNDAKAQALAEQAAWPYTWYTNPSYIQETGRGTVTGKLVINDAGSPSASAANTWVGLAIPPAGASSATDFQDWSKNYQFWVKTDAAGNFTIPHVLPGTYSLFAFGSGANGQLSLANYATVTAGNATALGNISWTPARVAPTVWEIGVPDRNATEYRHGTDWWTSNTYPDTRWGIFLNYPDEFPDDVNFMIGQSKITNDWNFAHYWDKNVRVASPAWKVNFNLATAPTSGSTASVYVAIADSKSAALILHVNGTNVTSPSTGISFGTSGNAMIRKGIHGAFDEVRFDFPASLLKAGANQISFTIRVTGSETIGDIMYDYVRLEAAGTSLVPYTALPVSISTIKAYPKQQGIQVEWTVQTEANASRYEVEKSIDGRMFSTMSSLSAKGNGVSPVSYDRFDNSPNRGSNFYRIKAIDNNGKTQYSKVVKVALEGGISSLGVYPNPLTGSSISLQLNNLKKGQYRLLLFNALGQKVMEKVVVHYGGSSVQIIELPDNSSSGLYYLEVSGNEQVFHHRLIKN